MTSENAMITASSFFRCGAHRGKWLIALFVVSFVWSISAFASKYTITGDAGTIRSGPGGDYTAITTVQRGAIVDATGRKGNWLEIKTDDDRRGWIFRGLAEPVGLSSQATSSSSATAQLADDLIGNYWLLAIGINKYAHWPVLNNPVNDAQAIVALLTSQFGFDRQHVRTLYDEQATAENLFAAFLQLKDQIKPTDSLLVYYAGHGILDQFDTASWIPVDVRQNALSDYISADRINRVLAKLPARHIFLIADACYSGSLFNSRGAALPVTLGDDRYFVENARRMSRQALTSGGTERVADGGAVEHSIFAHHLINELAQDSSPYIAASALSARVQQLVARNSQQEPTWDHLKGTGDENGEFFFVRRAHAHGESEQEPTEIPSHLTLHTYPFGALLRVNGEVVGTAPVTLTGLSGNINVEATMDGFQKTQETVRLRYDRDQSLVLRLPPIAGSGRLAVTTTPSGARWYLNGAYMGTTPDQVVNIPAGTHVLTTIKEGLDEHRQTVRVRNDELTTVALDLNNIAHPGDEIETRSASDAQAERRYDFSQRHAQGIDELEKLLGDFVSAYQLRDSVRLQTLAVISPPRRAFIDHLFDSYQDVQLQLVDLNVAAQSATATVKIEKLVRRNGDEVIPSDNWNSARLSITRDGDHWGQIHWH